jgi:hypothetical protein
MRGDDTSNHTVFSYVRTNDRIPSNHPLGLTRIPVILNAHSGRS